MINNHMDKRIEYSEETIDCCECDASGVVHKKLPGMVHMISMPCGHCHGLGRVVERFER